MKFVTLVFISSLSACGVNTGGASAAQESQGAATHTGAGSGLAIQSWEQSSKEEREKLWQELYTKTPAELQAMYDAVRYHSSLPSAVVELSPFRVRGQPRFQVGAQGIVMTAEQFANLVWTVAADKVRQDEIVAAEAKKDLRSRQKVYSLQVTAHRERENLLQSEYSPQEQKIHSDEVHSVITLVSQRDHDATTKWKNARRTMKDTRVDLPGVKT